jgi:hypothetical protein
MKLHRSLFPRKFISNFIRVTDHQLSQIKTVRLAMGGIWVKLEENWYQVDVLWREQDGSMLLSRTPFNGGAAVSFWSTNNAVQDLEDYR